MKKFIPILILLISSQLSAQQVANYYTGTYGSKDYEHFSFYKNRQIEYSYGKKQVTVNVSYIGKEIKDGMRIFSIQFPNGSAYQVIPGKFFLTVLGINNSYLKIFEWEYQGPINGRGTFCSSCAPDSKAAAHFMRKYYLK